MTTAIPDVETQIYAYPYFEFVKNKKIISIVENDAIISRDLLVDLMSPMLRSIKFDPDFYRSRYPDLAKAEAEGIIADLHEHYLRFGFFENRLPCLIEVDGSFYAREYPDVAVAILENRVSSAQSHFEISGFIEGRVPRKGWTFAALVSA
jgi:hypothetical protein